MAGRVWQWKNVDVSPKKVNEKTCSMEKIALAVIVVIAAVYAAANAYLINYAFVRGQESKMAFKAKDLHLEAKSHRNGHQTKGGLSAG